MNTPGKYRSVNATKGADGHCSSAYSLFGAQFSLGGENGSSRRCFVDVISVKVSKATFSRRLTRHERRCRTARREQRRCR